MNTIDTRWFTETLAAKGLSQRGLGRLLDCNASSVNRLINGKRQMRFDEAERLATYLGVEVSDIIRHAGVDVEMATAATVPLVGYIDGHNEAHVDWKATAERVPAPADVPPRTVAVQHRTAMTAYEMVDGWLLFVDPPDGDGHVERAVNRFSLVCFESGLTMLGFLRRGYQPGRYNLYNLASPPVENMQVEWAAPILWIKT